jgi:signal transduction histidine kinase
VRAIGSRLLPVPARWLPRRTVRLRLTLLYGGLFVAAGAVLLAITYGLVANSVSGHTVQFRVSRPASATVHEPAPEAIVVTRPGSGPLPVPPPLRTVATKLQAAARAEVTRQRQAQLDALLTRSGIALGIMAIVSIGLGWVMAGRALRPVRTMGARARGISERNLHERLAIDGPDDELKELADTFDGLLERLEAAFESQRRFVANASHELRTPITLERTLVEVALADPHASVASLRDTCGRVLVATEQQERLIEALLTLARSQRGLDSREELDLADVVQDVMRSVAVDGLRVESELDDAPASGDPRLLERLVANLVDNAVHYNVADGWVSVRTGTRDGWSTLVVSNAGPVVAESRVGELLEPFRRLSGDRPGRTQGLGLGLSIVSAIAGAHGAGLAATPRPGGGLDVEVRFPAPARPRDAISHTGASPGLSTLTA